MKKLFPIILLPVLGLTSACTFSLPTIEAPESIPVGTIKPELDFSDENPDCATAAKVASFSGSLDRASMIWLFAPGRHWRSMTYPISLSAHCGA